jgi:hypothetical protein
MFKPDETANELFRRLTFPFLRFSLNDSEKCECFSFGTCAEITLHGNCLIKNYIKIMSSFFSTYKNGDIYLLGIGSNLQSDINFEFIYVLKFRQSYS